MRLALLPKDILCDTDSGSISKRLFHLVTEQACIKSFKAKSLLPSLNKLPSDLCIVRYDTDGRRRVLHAAQGLWLFIKLQTVKIWTVVKTLKCLLTNLRRKAIYQFSHNLKCS